MPEPTLYWEGIESTNWQDGDAWVRTDGGSIHGQPPDANTDCYFTVTSSSANCVANNSSCVCGSITVTDWAQNLSVPSGSKITLKNSLTLTNSATYTGDGEVVLTNTGTWSGNGILAIPLTINTAGTITVSGTVYYNTGTLTYTAGTVTTTGSTLYINSACTLDTDGIAWNNVTFRGAGVNITVTLTSDLDINGNLLASGTGGNSAVTLNRTDATHGNITAAGNLTLSVCTYLQGTSVITLDGTGTWSASTNNYLKTSLTINTAGTITISGRVYISAIILTYTTGTVTTTSSTLQIASGTSTLDTDGIDWNNLEVTYGGDVTISSPLSVLGYFKSFATAASSNILNGSTMTVGGDLNIDNEVTGTTEIILNGTGTWTCNDSSAYVANDITINTAGTITISGTVYYKTGTLTYTAGTVTTTSSNLFLVGACTLDTDGIDWNNVTAQAAGTYTLSSDLSVDGQFYNVNVSVFNSNSIIISGDLSLQSGISGTSTILLDGTGTWSTISASGIVSNDLTINTAGTITVSGNVYYKTGTMTHTAGTVTTTSSTLNLKGACTLDTDGIIWENMTVNAGVTVTCSSNLRLDGGDLKSATPDSIFTIAAASGMVRCSDATLQDADVSGDAIFYAGGCTNLGNNSPRWIWGSPFPSAYHTV